MPATKTLKTCRTCFYTAKPENVFPLQSQSCLPDPETVEQMLQSIVPELNLNAIPNPVLCKDCLVKLRMSFRFRRMCVRNEKMQLAQAGNDVLSVIKQAALLDHAYEVEGNPEENVATNNGNVSQQHDVATSATEIIDSESDNGQQFEETHYFQQEEVIVDNFDTFDVPTEPITINTIQEYQQKFENKSRPSETDSKSDKYKTDCFQITQDLPTKQPVTVVASTSKLVCSKCPKVCSSYREAALHAQHEHNKKRTICCKICKKFFTSTYLYKKHAKTHGLNVKKLIKVEPLKLECKECKTTFSRSHLFCKHMIEQHQKKFPKCFTCHKSFPNVRLLKLHISRHRRVGINRSYLCHVCGKNFSNYALYYRHKCAHVKEKKFGCELCSKQFSKKSALRLHVDITHSSEKKHMCELCGRQFKHIKSLVNHKKIGHGKAAKTEHCQVCGKGFYYKSSLKVHSEIHKDVKAYKCEICDRGFRNSSNLQRHMCLHTGEKPYVCDYCGRKFTRAKALQIHQAVEGDAKCKGANESQECQVCNRKFKCERGLVKHLKVHTVDCTKDVSSATCEICGRTFSSRSFLKNHMITHVEKSYVCDICGKRFRRNYTLSLHYRVHTGEKPDQCNLCGEYFINVAVLKRHQKKSHFVNVDTAKIDDNTESGTVIQYSWKMHSE